ncbi:MAG: HAD-IG family 5'-nucleotidase [Rubricoccaceae bacterium]|nr:HAD-IG family 5'-nucleotidase [Rubricoccaceae bacterium]
MPDTNDIPRPGLFCNRTLNLRTIKAIGYDMDYTLLHYHVALWEERAYSYVKNGLTALGWPVDHLVFDPELVTQGLVVDTELGNVVKANRFGYIKRAFHGTRPLSFEEMRDTYRRTLVDLHLPRWRFMNTLFSISEASLYLQVVDMLDAGKLPPGLGYDGLYQTIRNTLDEAHLEGRLKAEIIADPDRFVDLDPLVPLTLLDQKNAGKKILLITNSEWEYTSPMLTYAFDPFLPENMTWRDLFDIAILNARKPAFFSERPPAYEIVDDEGLLRSHKGELEEGRVFVGGNAEMVEETLGLRGEEILYVGDHIFADVKASKSVFRWRTALVLRSIEDEVAAMEAFANEQADLEVMMTKKEQMESQYSAMRLERQRNSSNYAPKTGRSDQELASGMQKLREELVALDNKIRPLVERAGTLVNRNWGPLMRAGNDKSHFADQVEASADIYTGRVSDFLASTPFVYLRSQRGSLPHDPS